MADVVSPTLVTEPDGSLVTINGAHGAKPLEISQEGARAAPEVQDVQRGQVVTSFSLEDPEEDGPSPDEPPVPALQFVVRTVEGRLHHQFSDARAGGGPTM